MEMIHTMATITYNSASKGKQVLTEMNTVHLQNVVAKAQRDGVKSAGGVELTVLEAELNTRTDRTDIEQPSESASV